MDNNNKFEELRGIVRNESLGIEEREQAAQHLVRLLTTELAVPADTDPEVIELQKPWPNKVLATLCAKITEGRTVTGYTLPDAIDATHKRRKWDLLKKTRADDSEHPLIREAAKRLLSETFTSVYTRT